MGLPRSRLVKSKSPEALGVATTMPQMSPLQMTPFTPEVPAAAALSPVAARDPFRTKADSIEIEMDGGSLPPVSMPSTIPSSMPEHEPMRGPYASAPSASELLERAAALGPARTTWESMVLPADPILDEKRQPHVAERRARLTRVVKLTLGACLAVCVVALGVSAIGAVSGDSTPDTKSAASAPVATGVGKMVPSKSVVPVEPMVPTKHAKASRYAAAPAATTAAIVRPKRR